MALEIEEFLHTERLPHIWCPGCGVGMVTGAFLRAMVDLGLKRESTVVVSGIGCSSRAANYIDLGTVHSIHGRALAVATGIKMARPNFTVVVFTGDGDGAAIGGNHLIHACRRNIDLTCILFNNQTYGMTGGQTSPTMDVGDRSTTARSRPGGAALRSLPAGRGGGRELRGPGHRRTHPPDGEADQAGHRAQRLLLHRGGGALSDRIRHGGTARRTSWTCWRTSGLARSRWPRPPSCRPRSSTDKIVTGVLHEDTTAPEFQQAYAASARAQAEAAAMPWLPAEKQ